MGIERWNLGDKTEKRTRKLSKKEEEKEKRYVM